jgi:aminodeoxychorismate synthase component I
MVAVSPKTQSRRKARSEPFVSLNYWHQPGLILQAVKPKKVIAGGPGDWPKLDALLRYYRETTPENRRDKGAAVGFFTYEGDFWFGFFSEVQFIPTDLPNLEKLRHRRRGEEIPGREDWQSNLSRAEFDSGVARAIEYIRAGDVYQINLSQRFSRPFSGDPYALYEQLFWSSPAPGGAFINTGQMQVLSASPELFLRITGRTIVTRPIKGTRRRGHNPMEDQKLANELMSDPKEHAELLMITDLERNDLGQVCEYGSVLVRELAKLERFAQVFHLVSTVEGTLRPGVDALAAIQACYPGGSITGAPKRRARQIITELEPGPRGVYCGAIGYFRFNGDAAFNIAIRTLTLENGELAFGVGAGITADSDPAREYEETLSKSEGLKLALDEYTRVLQPVVRG